MNPKISVIVPVYKVEKYLRACVDSILAQTFTDFEVLLVNDGSPDQSGEICDEYVSKDNRVRVFHNENNGAGFSRKFGVNNAIGQYVMFVDSDDTLPINALQELYRCNTMEDYDIIVGNLLRNDVLYQHYVCGELSGLEYTCAVLEFKTMIGPVAKLYKRNLFNKIKWETPHYLIINEDLYMLVLLAITSHKVLVNPNIIVYNYILHPGSSSSRIMGIDGWKFIFGTFNKLFKDKSEKLKKSLIHYELKCLYIYCILNGIYIYNYKDLLCASQCKLDFNESLKMHLIKYVWLQKFAFYNNKFLSTIKSNIKPVLRICRLKTYK